MSLSVVLHPDALRELGDAIEAYDQGGQGRGARFRANYDRVIDRCLDWPESAEVVAVPGSEKVFRRARVPRSHYGVVYYVIGDALKVVAITHERRRPLYWTGRS